MLKLIWYQLSVTLTFTIMFLSYYDTFEMCNISLYHYYEMINFIIININKYIKNYVVR